MQKTRYYYDFNFSLDFVELVMALLRGKGQAPSNFTDTSSREWFSTPRLGESTDTECVTITFKLPVSVSEVSTEILRMPCRAELWYQDRSNNWRPVLDQARAPLRVTVGRSDTKSWYRWSSKCHPIVAKRFQVRLTRVYDPATQGVPYPLGLRNTLVRRNVYDRRDANSFADEVDVMGNVVSRHVRDWDARRAVDDNYGTFWRSAPQPDPAAVVSLYLDVRADDGSAQVVDKIYIDPVYSDQNLNIYHSVDDTVGTRFLSPITAAPEGPVVFLSGKATAVGANSLTDSSATWPVGRWAGYHLLPADDPSGAPVVVVSNTATTLTTASAHGLSVGDGYQIVSLDVLDVGWLPRVGLVDEGATQESFYRWPLGVGCQKSQDGWVGVEWRPGFGSADPNLARDPVLFSVLPGVYPSSAARPLLRYDPLGRVFSFETSDGGSWASEPIDRDWDAGESLRVVVAWRYGPRSVLFEVRDDRGRVVVSTTVGAADLPDVLDLGGRAGVSSFTGSIANMVVKMEPFSATGFLADPSGYCEPEPAPAGRSGRPPSTTLDNAVYAAAFTVREHGTGGGDQSHFEDKEWEPVWRDYVVQKGMLHLPRAVAAKYIKLEFSNLSEQPYPIYESGVEARYKVFPIQVTQQATLGPRLYTGEGGFLGLGTFISVNGVRSVNWLDPASVLDAVGAVTGPRIPPVVVNSGTPYVTDSLPANGAAEVENSRSLEVNSAYVYSRDAIRPYVLASDRYNTLIKAEGLQAISEYVEVPWTEIEEANPGAVTKVKSVGTVPIRGTDWWIYPGQQLKIPASVMVKMTETQTVTERKFALEGRLRFNTTSVHRYETRTVKRDAAIAYFAGVREVQPYVSTYVAGDDRPVWDFPVYDDGWVLGNAVRTPSNAVTPALPNTWAVVSRRFTTRSDFSKLTVRFSDSGLARSNSMWADQDAQASTIDDVALSPYLGVLPRIKVLAEGVATSGTEKTLTDTSADWTPGAFEGRTLTVVAGRGRGGRWPIVSNTEDTLTVEKPTIFDLTVTGFPTGGSFTVVLGGQETEPVVWSSPAVTASSLASALRALPAVGQTGAEVVPGSSPGSFTVTLVPAEQLSPGNALGLTGGNDPQVSTEARPSFDSTTRYEVGGLSGANWSDSLATWDDAYAEWGTAYGVVSVAVDGERRYLGRRVVRFTREGSLGEDDPGQSGEAGLTLKQFTNLVPGAMFRVVCTFYRPVTTGNELYLTLRRTSDGAIVFREALEAPPPGQWVQRSTPFVEIPETLPHAGFDGGLTGWTPAGGGQWTADTTKGRTASGSALGSAKLVAGTTASTLTSQLLDCDAGTTVSCSAWVSWSGLATGQASAPVRLEALMCDDDGDVVSAVTLGQGVTPTASTSQGWVPLSGSAAVPRGEGVTQVRFRLVVDAAVGQGSLWVDDFSVDVPGTPRQRYEVWLTAKGEDREEIYVSDLGVETTPVRYFVRLGPPADPDEELDGPVSDANLVEVTDLRHAGGGEATVTCTEPVNDVLVQVVVTTQRAAAVGCRITPHYLR